MKDLYEGERAFFIDQHSILHSQIYVAVISSYLSTP